MASVSQFYSQEFIDSTSLNNAVSGVIAATDYLSLAALQPGLVSPGSMSFGVTGLSVSASLPSPFGILFGSFILSQAHGTVNGQDTQTYNISLSGAVPASGSTTAYILASYVQILQNQFAIIGPPPGHPDFNPNFQPYNAYSTAVDSLVLTVSTTGADNSTTFEIARAMLAAGATGAVLNTDYWQRASEKHHYPIRSVSATGLVNTQAGQLLQLPSGSNIYTLPPLSLVNGQEYVVSHTASGSMIIVQASTTDSVGINLIFGCFPNPGLGYPAFIVEKGNAVKLLAANGYWQVMSGTARSTMFRAMQTSDTNYYINAQSGSDSNSGLAPGAAWQHLQYGHDWVHNNVDLAGYRAVFNSTGNFTAGVESTGPFVGQTQPYNAIFAFSSGSSVIVSGACCFLAHDGASLVVSGPVVLQSTGAYGGNPEGGFCLRAESQSCITIQAGPLAFGPTTNAHVSVGWGGLIRITSAYTIQGGASGHYWSDSSGMIISTVGQGSVPPPPPTTPFTITLSGGPNFPAGFAYSNGGNIWINAQVITFSGSGTGPRYTVGLPTGFIYTFGGGSNYFPGSTPGTGTAYANYA